MTDLDLLLKLGSFLDRRPFARELSVRDSLAMLFLKIRDRDGRLVPLVPNRTQRLYSQHCTRRNLVLKARQLGVTTWIAARFFLHTITRRGTLTVQVAHDQRAAEAIFAIVHRFLENLPERLRRGALRTSRDNVRQIVFPALDSEYRVETAADPDAGRGLTIQNLHCSEVARWTGDPQQTLAALRAAVPAAGEIVLESTPDGASGCFYEEWHRAKETGYAQHFYPWFWEPTYIADPALEPLTDDERELMQRCGLSLPQIGFRRQVRANFRRLGRQEYAEDPDSCFLASGECVFDPDALELRIAACSEPAQMRDHGRLMVWFPPRPERQYILGVDPAGGGTDGDYSCVQVIERASGLQCAELVAHLPPAELAARAAQLAREYNDALIAVERNNHGHAVLAYLTTAERYDNLYCDGGKLGWLTSAVSRPAMIVRLGNVLAEAPHLVCSPRLLRDCRTFVRHADGTTSAASGAHDDTVMAMSIALSAREESAATQPPHDSLGQHFISLPA